MEKDRSSKIIAIVALVVAVVSLSLGFAAFTKDLNITFSESNVKVSGVLDMKFLASEDPNDTNTSINAVSSSEVISANLATISTDGTTISGMGVTFSDKDQTVDYGFYIYNNSEYDAYLNAVDFLNYTGADANKVCTALTGTTQSLVDDSCNDITVVVSFDTDGDGGFDSVVDTGTSGFTSIKVSKGAIVPALISIKYDGSSTSSILPDGDFKINFGEIKFSFSSLEG